MQKNHNRTRTLVTCSMLVALEIILARFCSIQAWDLRIGFSFVAIAIAGALYGPIGGGIVGAVADFLGANLFPMGMYFPGFTVTAFLTGIIYGIFLHKKRNFKNIFFAVLLQQFACSFLLNTIWLSILYGSPIGPLFLTRIVQTAILIPVQIIVLFALSKGMHRVARHVTA